MYISCCKEVFQTSDFCSCLMVFLKKKPPTNQNKPPEVHVVFWECSLCEGNVSSFCCLSVCPFKDCIDLSDPRMYLEGLCSLTLFQLCKISFRMWFSRIRYTDFSHSFPIQKVPVDFPLRVQLWFYSGTFGSYFRLLCINSRGWTCSKKKKTPRKALFILVMILVLTRLMNCSFPTSFKIFLCTLTLLDMEISGSSLSQFVAGFTEVN